MKNCCLNFQVRSYWAQEQPNMEHFVYREIICGAPRINTFEEWRKRMEKELKALNDAFKCLQFFSFNALDSGSETKSWKEELKEWMKNWRHWMKEELKAWLEDIEWRKRMNEELKANEWREWRIEGIEWRKN